MGKPIEPTSHNELKHYNYIDHYYDYTGGLSTVFFQHLSFNTSPSGDKFEDHLQRYVNELKGIAPTGRCTFIYIQGHTKHTVNLVGNKHYTCKIKVLG